MRRNLAPLPVADGLFIHTAEWNDTYTKRAWEHPDPIGVLGMFALMDGGVDPQIAKRTVGAVWKIWDWSRCWGWDFPWIAMAAARTGQPQIAVDALLNSAKDSVRRMDCAVVGILPATACSLRGGDDGCGMDGSPSPVFPLTENGLCAGKVLRRLREHKV